MFLFYDGATKCLNGCAVPRFTYIKQVEIHAKRSPLRMTSDDIFLADSTIRQTGEQSCGHSRVAALLQDSEQSAIPNASSFCRAPHIQYRSTTEFKRLAFHSVAPAISV